MSFWKKFSAAVRGAGSEAGEAFVDANAMRILDQEIRDAKADLGKAKDGLASVMAKAKLSEKRVEDLAARISEYEGHAIKAMEAGNDALATEVAEKIAELEGQKAQEDSLLAEFRQSEATLKATIRKTERQLKGMESQVESVKATEAVQRAQSAVAARHSGVDSSMRTATDSLARIKERQNERRAKFEAAEELASEEGDSGLDAKLRAAGITDSAAGASDVLARLRAKQAS